MTPLGDGVNVAVVSRHATRVSFCIFDDDGQTERARFALPLRMGDVHYGFVAGVGEGTRYGFRAEGPWSPEHGHRFDAAKVLTDPYALRLDRPYAHSAELTRRGADTAALVPKAVVTTVAADAVPLSPHRPQFIYEIPVRAFTRLHPKIPTEKRGTVAALGEIAVIDHLTRLGVDTVELMPLTAWIDERHLAAHGLANAWGYNPVTFMAPDPRLAPGGLAEIRAAVDALHDAGIRVILDVVFNHTGESDEHGATLSLRGFDNALYYAQADGELINDTGCGNTLALNRAPVTQLAMDAMRSWVRRTGIDGFRFDLAPVLGRTPGGFERNAPLLTAIEQDPLLSRLIMIAEPWDVGPGGYQLGAFPPRWHEWNDRYRDDVRRFWRGDANGAGSLATRIAGSSDVFSGHRQPSSSINYVAAHDGFTLRDTVTYLVKNNHANGEGNRDGNAHEPTWPKGNVRALLATLFLSLGTPMLTAGDEFGRTQRGNNNAYAQDNETTWLDWAEADHDLIDFAASLARLRQSLPQITEDRFLSGAVQDGSADPDAEWLGADGGPMNWHDENAAVVGLVLAGNNGRLALWFNRGPRSVRPHLPKRDGYRWKRNFCSASGNDLPARSVAVYAEERHRQTGVSDETIAVLARDAGVETGWWEVDGTHHEVTPETLRAVLTALRLPHATADDVTASRRTLERNPGPIVGISGHIVEIAGEASHRRQFRIKGESGEIAVDVVPGEPVRVVLPPGYHDVSEDGTTDGTRRVIVSPGTCYLPGDIADGARVFGLASHLYALRHDGDGGIGDFETLRRFADLTETIGGRYAGLNPLHHLFPTDRRRVSPYQPSDRRYVDPIYINIERLLKRFALPKARALVTKSRAALAGLEALPGVDYAAVWAAKREILEAAFADFKGDGAFDRFVAEGGDDLVRHGRFEAETAADTISEDRVTYRAFLQWIADTQLGEAAKHQSLYRDLAVGCAFDGGEIAQSPDHFSHGVSLGAPPDPFSRTGQVWNLPPFSPLALAARNFEPMRAILAANMRHAAALRIDHVLGFARQFWVPRGEEGNLGAYVRFPMEALVAITAIESRRHNCLIVGEDLGTVPDGFRERLALANIFSYRVLWFERDGASFGPPEHYPQHALACLASHDLPTFMGWRAARDIDIELELGRLTAPEAERRRTERCHEIQQLDQLASVAAGSGAEAGVAVHGLVARTPSQIMLIQADDLSGETEPLNVPGTDTERPNWQRRLGVTVDRLASEPLAMAIIRRVKAERGR